MKFDAFISYRHAELDSAVAGYLQKALEHYRVPGEIQKKCGKQKLSRVFRDEEELGVASDLFGEIEENLKHSEFLIVICSPRLPESKWCLREIETFIRFHGRDHILAVLVEGEPEEAFPPILLEEGEPLAADLRGRTKNEVLKFARQRLVRLVAPLLHCTYDELYQRHRLYRMRRLAALACAAACLCAAVGAVTVSQMLEIRKNYRAKLENQGRYLAETSDALLEEGDRSTAIAVALEALPESSRDTSRPYVPEARIALENALYTYTMDLETKLRPLGILQPQNPENGYVWEASDEERVLLTADIDNKLYAWDAKTLEQISVYQSDIGQLYDAKLVGEDRAVAAGEQSLVCYNHRTGETLWQWTMPENPYGKQDTGLVLAYSAESGRLFCIRETLSQNVPWDADPAEAYKDVGFCLLNPDDGTARELSLSSYFAESDPLNNFYVTAAQFSPDGSHLALAITESNYQEGYVVTSLLVWDLEQEEIVFRQTIKYPAENVSMTIHWLDEQNLVTATCFASGLNFFTSEQQPWILNRWNLGQDAPVYTYEDRAMSTLSYEALIQELTDEDEELGEKTLLAVSVGNVLVNLDAETGQCYSRLEDRNPFVFHHMWSMHFQLAVTQDGYVFSTDPMKDLFFVPKLTQKHYDLSLPPIMRAVWLNRRLFLETDVAAYCYGGWVDMSGEDLAFPVQSTTFTEDQSCFLIRGGNGELAAFERSGETYNRLWESSCSTVYQQSTAALLESRQVAAISADNTKLTVHDLRTGEEAEAGALADTWQDWALRNAEDNHVLAWDTSFFYLPESSEEENQPLLSVLDCGSAQWSEVLSLQNLLDALPAELLEEPAWQGASCRILNPICADPEQDVLFELHLKQQSDWEHPNAEREELRLLFRYASASGPLTSLSEELVGEQQEPYSNYTHFSGLECVDLERGRAAIYDAADQEIRILDVRTLEITDRIPMEAVNSSELAFTPDGQFLLFQNGVGDFLVYDLGQQRYTMHENSLQGLFMDYSFYADGDYLIAQVTADTFIKAPVRIYRRETPGVYKLEVSIPGALTSDGQTVVMMDSQFPRFYKVHDFDWVLEEAHRLLKGRELTDVERRRYLID